MPHSNIRLFDAARKLFRHFEMKRPPDLSLIKTVQPVVITDDLSLDPQTQHLVPALGYSSVVTTAGNFPFVGLHNGTERTVWLDKLTLTTDISQLVSLFQLVGNSPLPTAVLSKSFKDFDTKLGLPEADPVFGTEAALPVGSADFVELGRRNISADIGLEILFDPPISLLPGFGSDPPGTLFFVLARTDATRLDATWEWRENVPNLTIASR